jgi:hypothetical protein
MVVLSDGEVEWPWRARFITFAASRATRQGRERDDDRRISYNQKILGAIAQEAGGGNAILIRGRR